MRRGSKNSADAPRNFGSVLAISVGSTDTCEMSRCALRSAALFFGKRGAAVTLTAAKRLALKNSLELKLRRSKGVRLQEFFAAVMVKVHGDAFVPVGSDYSRGDLKCDGMLMVPLTIFACYGGVNAGASATQASMKTAVAKVDTDFAGALAQWPDLKVWCFVHNYLDIPPQIVRKILDLRAANPDRQIMLFGKDQFSDALFGLEVADIEDLIGDAATAEDFRDLQPKEVFQVVADVMARVDHRGVPDDLPVEVPERKLHFNGLSPICQLRIREGFVNAGRVAALLQDHPDPMMDDNLAATFKEKYLELKAHADEPDDVLFGLIDFTVGGARVSAAREVAVWSIVAHLFEKCTIFEDAPVEETFEHSVVPA